jgi:hypothetical protein
VNFKTIQIDAAKYDTCIRRSRHKPQLAVNGRVKANAFDFDRALNRKLKWHERDYFNGTLVAERIYFVGFFSVSYG